MVIVMILVCLSSSCRHYCAGYPSSLIRLGCFINWSFLVCSNCYPALSSFLSFGPVFFILPTRLSSILCLSNAMIFHVLFFQIRHTQRSFFPCFFPYILSLPNKDTLLVLAVPSSSFPSLFPHQIHAYR